MEKQNNKATAVVTVIFIIAILILLIFLPDDKKTDMESRASEGFPCPSASDIADGTFGKEMSIYIADRFPGRKFLMSMKARLESAVGEGIVNEIYLSDDRLIDTAVSSRDMSANIIPIKSFASNYDGAVYLVAVPTSSGTYSSSLPKYRANTSEKQQIDKLYSDLGSSVRKIDAYNILKPLSDNYIYFRSDSKWTSYGAYCVYKTVIQKLVFIPNSYDKYSIRHVFRNYRGDLYGRTQYMKCQDDILDVYEYSGGEEVLSCLKYDNDGNFHDAVIYDTDAAESSGDAYDMYLGEDAPLMKIRTSVNNNRKLLVIKDRFADCFIPFLLQHYSEIAVVSPECMDGKLNDHIDPDDYEQALFLFGLDTLSEKGALDLLY